MKKFRFPLRPVAVLREHEQARTREAFAATVHTFVQAEGKLTAKRAERRDLEVMMHDGRRVDREAQLESDELAGLRVARRLAAATVTST